MSNKKTCGVCGRTLPEEEFYLRRVGESQRHTKCKPCWRLTQKLRLATESVAARASRLAYMREYAKAHPDVNMAAKIKYRNGLRQAALAAYGSVCACCGESEQKFLAIDHIHGGGGAHRREIGVRIEWWLKTNGYPPGFRVLCHNCNMARAFYKICPHEVAAYDAPYAVRMA